MRSHRFSLRRYALQVVFRALFRSHLGLRHITRLQLCFHRRCALRCRASCCFLYLSAQGLMVFRPYGTVPFVLREAAQCSLVFTVVAAVLAVWCRLSTAAS